MSRKVLLFAFCYLLSGLSFAGAPDGYVVRVDSKTVYLDWGKPSGVQAGDQFQVYRPGEPLKHPVTGEILGNTMIPLGSGSLESVEDKFSIGHLIDVQGPIHAGDRVKQQETASPASAPPSGSAAPETSLPSLRERWRSESLPDPAVGMTLADLNGDGQKEIVVAFRTKIQVFRWSASHLESIAVYEDRHFRHWLAIDAADVRHQGHDEIFATTFLDGLGRSRVVILRLENNQLKRAADLDGFTRSVERLDGSRQLLWQSMSRSREMHYTSPAELIPKKDGYDTGSPIKLPRTYNDQLFGFTFGDWDGDGAEDMAILVTGERLRLFFKNSNWMSSDVYGGTQSDFSVGDQVGSFIPRLLNWKPANGKPQLIVPYNIPELGIRLTYLKLYKKSEIIGLSWNGLEMAPVWTLPIAGYLADDAVGDGLHESTPQLWAATVGPGDKTVLLAYSLP